ncbi:MAG: MerR family transcriptional regulator [Burkholderiales bacterium]
MPTKRARRPQSPGAEAAYRTGAAARLAGIEVETLRVWERRYRVVGPHVSASGHRLYSAEDVRRLTLIRQLVDAGSAIGAIARLPMEALLAMRHAEPAGARPARVALVGEALNERIAREAALRPGIDVVADVRLDHGSASLAGVSVDLMAIEMPALQADAILTVESWARAANARQVVVEYRFAPATVLGALRERGISVVRAPLDADELVRLGGAMLAFDPPAPAPLLGAVPGPRFDDASLARLAQSLTTLHCECPRHLADLLLGLGAFERYSAGCAHRSPADAVLHRYLQEVAAGARVRLEEALVRVARAEGMALPDDPAKASLAA